MLTLGLIAAIALVGWSTRAWIDRQWTVRRSWYLDSRRPYLAKSIDEVATLPPELRESSGLVVSRTHPGLLWSHNDSGDGPNLYALDMSGRLLATVPVAGARAQDWEDMASGPCPTRLLTGTDRISTRCLYVADTGNNGPSRDIFSVYVMVEPEIGKPGSPAPSVVAQSFRFRYSGQPVDCEALAVRPDGDVTIVSKGQTGSVDFAGFSPADVERGIASGEVLTAEQRGNTGIVPDAKVSRLVTGAAVSPDGMTLAVRTYNEIFFYRADVGEGGALRWRDLARPCSLGDAEPQGEAIDYLDAQTLLLTSETAFGRAGTIHRVTCS